MGKRGLLLFWHAWGYWVLTVALAAAAPMEWMAVAIVAVYVAFWLFGVVRAALRRDSTVVVRCVGFAGFALAWLAFLVPEDFKLRWFWGDWQSRLRLALVLAVCLAGMLLIALVHAGLTWRSHGRRSRWRWPAVLFPLVVFGAMLLFQFVPWAAGLALLVFAVVWLCGLAWACEAGERLLPRCVGLGVAAGLLAAWPPVSLAASRDDIAELVLRHEMALSSCTSFVEVEGEDASGELLRRLSVLGSVKPGSAAGHDEHRCVIDHETGNGATILWVGSIRRSVLNPCAIEVKVGCAGGPLCGSGETYWVAWWFGRWVVVAKEFDWVS